MGAQHWADVYAEKIIREKDDKELYVCASGISPSGTVHIGNFREIISVDLVVRALRERGKKVRFIYSWDDYDVFRKVPANMPGKELLQDFLRKPITLTPDPLGREESYARRNEKEVEALLPRVGIRPEYIYQAQRYRSSVYAEGIRLALAQRETLRDILNEHRTTPLPEEWWPVAIFCSACHRDSTRLLHWDGEYGLSYDCSACGYQETLDLKNSAGAKLLWRIDWPMRWAYEGVDFEPAGKDHHSEGGSFDTARQIVERVYRFQAPTTFQYDFIGIKGGGGKISSSTGEVVGLRQVLEIYQPEIVRYLFASTRPNTEFSISFDLDVIKIYEDYDRCQRIYFGQESVGEQRALKERRIYQLSQIDAVPARPPLQIPFRHLCNLLQTTQGKLEPVLELLELKAGDEELIPLRSRARCAWNWITQYAPEDFRFALREPEAEPLAVTDPERRALSMLRQELAEKLATRDERVLSETIYAVARGAGLEPKDFFKLVYRVLIDQERGPRLAGFLLTLGKTRVLELLKPY